MSEADDMKELDREVQLIAEAVRDLDVSINGMIAGLVQGLAFHAIRVGVPKKDLLKLVGTAYDTDVNEIKERGN